MPIRTTPERLSLLEALAEPRLKRMPEQIDAAQELIYDALDGSQDRAPKLLMQALKLDPHHPDALSQLLNSVAATPDEKLNWLRRIDEIGQANLTTLKDKRSLWDVLPARPALRTKFSLALELVDQLQLEEAQRVLETRLKLDSNDHQGARYVLLGILQARQLTDAAEALLKKNKGDPGVTFVWGRVFQAWCTSPQTASVVLVQALETQPHGLEVILMAELPDGAGLDSYRRGSLEEALAEGPLLRRPWLTVPKARTWLSEAHQTFSREAARSRHKKS